MQALCNAACARTADALAATSKRLRAVLAAGDFVNTILPVFTEPDRSLSCPYNVVTWDAATGTLRKMDHIARSHGIAPRVLKRSMDETITRYLMMMQRSYQEASPGKPLSRWHTPMQYL